MKMNLEGKGRKQRKLCDEFRKFDREATQFFHVHCTVHINFVSQVVFIADCHANNSKK